MFSFELLKNYAYNNGLILEIIIIVIKDVNNLTILIDFGQTRQIRHSR